VKRRRRSGLHGLLILLLTLMLTLGIPASAGASPGGAAKQIDPALVRQLQAGARGSVKISVNEATNFASFIVAGRNGDLLPSVAATPQGKAKGFLKQFGGLFGVGNAADLVQVASATDALGATHITYAQEYRGLPVFGGVLKVHVDAAGDLTAANGTLVPAIGLPTTPKLSVSKASATAIDAVAADPPGGAEAVGALRAESTELIVYRTGLIKGELGTNELAYQVVVTNGASVRDALFIHANTGAVINRYSLVDNALHRILYEQNTGNKVWEEGDPFPGSLTGDQQNILNFTEDSYNFFNNSFGRVSYDGADAHMRSVNNDPTIACPNANWNGATTNYCNGVTSDDVVAHEWGHAYTQYTSDLIYQWQPGALNESYSDIWGETVDLINSAGTDAPGTVRAVGACSSFSGPRVVVINSPASIAQTCPAGTATFGPAVTGAGVTGNVVLADDGAADPSTSNGCTAFVNAATVAGNIALVDRGVCGFAVKVKNAQNAGAIAVVVANNVEAVQGMGGADATITIPSLLIALSKGNAIKAELGLGSTVNVTLKQDPGPVTEDSYRWLMGEDSSAFQGAIRDMWTPTCLGDAGKVSDAQYHCATSDNGGVHSNSGVNNHAYALLVDGGAYNGQTITGLGLTKAAHIFWQSQAFYLTPASKFPDQADALEASCTDLIGQPLNALGTEGPTGVSGDVISLADCTEVSDVIAAVQLRTDPTQCNFQPLLDPDTANLCSNQKNPSTHYVEDFEDGLVGWTLTNEGVFSGWPGTDWAANSSAPGGHAGSTAFAEDINGGDCGGGAGDISGVMRLESPSIAVPNTAQLSPRVTFEHYVATETGWDGGNIKISINGGVFSLIPASAFQFNAYNATLQTVAAGNTNPLAGEPGFTGTDGGEVHGSWGVSQIDLSKLGVGPGDSFKLRFDFGMDGCTGVDGWYLDNIKLQSCNTKKNPVAALASRFDA
jgi:Zn-dependent metalloprotease